MRSFLIKPVDLVCHRLLNNKRPTQENWSVDDYRTAIEPCRALRRLRYSFNLTKGWRTASVYQEMKDINDDASQLLVPWYLLFCGFSFDDQPIVISVLKCYSTWTFAIDLVRKGLIWKCLWVIVAFCNEGKSWILWTLIEKCSFMYLGKLC